MALPGLGNTIKYVNSRQAEIKLGGGGTSSPKSTTAAALKSATCANAFSKPSSSGILGGRTSGVPLYGIGAQRSKVGTGQHLNASRFYSNTNFSFVQNMNQGAHFHKDFGMPMMEGCNHNQKASGWEIALGTMAALNALAPTITDIINSTKSTSKTSDITDLNNKTSVDYDSDKFKLTKELKGAKSFGDIKSLEGKVEQQLNSFKSDYKNIGTTSQQVIDQALAQPEVKAGLDLAGIDAKSIKLPELTELQFDTDDVSTFDDAARSIDKDIESVNKFSADLGTNIGTLENKSGELAKSIQSFTAQITSLESNIRELNTNIALFENMPELKAQAEADLAKAEADLKTATTNKEQAVKDKQQVDTAKAELKNVLDKECKNLTNQLTAKKDSLGDIKQVKAELTDKKYELAKSQDEEIGKNNKQMEKLEKQIEGRKAEGNTDMVKNLVDLYNEFSSENMKLGASLKDSGAAEFKNSKGKSYKLKNLNSAKTDIKSTPELVNNKNTGKAPKDVKLDLAANTKTPEDILRSQIENCDPMEMVLVNGGTYQNMGNDMFKDVITGQSISKEDLLAQLGD